MSEYERVMMENPKYCNCANSSDVRHSVDKSLLVVKEHRITHVVADAHSPFSFNAYVSYDIAHATSIV
jgi:hypothetical protein